MSSQERASVNYGAYILGPGDVLEIEVLDLPEFSGTVSIGPDGTIYLPRLRALYVEGLTLEELRLFITENTSTLKLNIYKTNQIWPIRIYIGEK